jgi:hypothetical protein
MLNDKFEMIAENFTQQFGSRILNRANDSTFKASLYIEKYDTAILIKMSRNEHQHTLSIPRPYTNNGVSLVSSNGVERAECQYYWKAQNRRMAFGDIMYEILFGFPTHMLPDHLMKSSSTCMQQLRFAYDNDRLAITVRNIQKRLDYIVNNLPIHNTDFNSLVMNHRITIFDPEFDVMSDPEEKHAYQVAKNKEYFQYGWSSLGLSDGCLADKNYILDCDLRKLSPFGLNFHNPQRNLYSTLGMKGDETPLVHSTTTEKLSNMGLTRKGWNLFTVFVDIPDVWEDQLMVDTSHTSKYVEYTKRHICHGKPMVKEGQSIMFGDPLYINKEEEVKNFDVQCDSAVVDSIEQIESTVGGVAHIVDVVNVLYRRYLKDGTKLTNLAANKGIIRVKDLGYAINPKTGEKQKIDVIVSAKAVVKRKNYTQVLEAILNNVNDNNAIVIPDDVTLTEEMIEKSLVDAGYNADGTWECHTYAGKLSAIGGNVFWGVTHDADDTTWKPGVTTNKNGRGLREAGLKFSNIEFRALTTRFGVDNPLEREIISYAQGHEDVKELLEVLKFKLGKTVLNHRVLDVKNVNPIRQEGGIMLLPEDLEGTILDPALDEEGFILKLPVKYQVSLDEHFNILAEGFPYDIEDVNGVEVFKQITFDTLYVPYDNLRKCWKHDIGRLGMNDVGNALNTVVVMCHNYLNDLQSGTTISMLYNSIVSYFKLVAGKLSTKRGEISTYGMSVRYPNSAKGVATLSNELPPNTIEIHETMARSIHVSTGDLVLVERFPCLGFMSLRPQRIKVTSDPLCKFTIRVSGNSLGSMGLDFDGDVLYIAAFYTEEAKDALAKEFYSPNENCYEQILIFNAKMGRPRKKEMTLADYAISPFNPLTPETHAEIVGKLTGVKSNTGPVVALAYNILRMMENSSYATDQRLSCGIEVFVDTIANSVFKQKHGVKSLHQIVTDAVCSADEQALLDEGFDPEVSRIICTEIRNKALLIGIDDVVSYHKYVLANGGSSVINRIVREQNVLYFTSRSSLEGCKLVRNVMNRKEVDIPSSIFNKIMRAPSRLQVADNKLLDSVKNMADRTYCEKVFAQINASLHNTKGVTILNKE